MAVIIVGAEKNFTALRPRLVSGKVSTTAMREITEAVAAANPHVDLKALEPGTVITVPDHPQISTHGDLSPDQPTLDQVIEGLTNAGGNILEHLAATARQRETEAVAERRNTAAALEAKEVDAAARKDSALAADVKLARDVIAQEDAQANDREGALKDAQKQWGAELKALKRLVS